MNGVSRLVVDPERFTDDAQEPMAAVGQGAVYTRTSDGSALRELLDGERDALLGTYPWRPRAGGASRPQIGLGVWPRSATIEMARMAGEVARLTGVGHARTAYRMPIEGRDEWVDAVERLA